MEKRGVIDEGTTPGMGPIRDDVSDVERLKTPKAAADVGIDDDLTRRMSTAVEKVASRDRTSCFTEAATGPSAGITVGPTGPGC